MKLLAFAGLAVGEAGNHINTTVQRVLAVDSADEASGALNAGKRKKSVLVISCVFVEEDLGANRPEGGAEFFKGRLGGPPREAADEHIEGLTGEGHHRGATLGHLDIVVDTV